MTDYESLFKSTDDDDALPVEDAQRPATDQPVTGGNWVAADQRGGLDPMSADLKPMAPMPVGPMPVGPMPVGPMPVEPMPVGPMQGPPPARPAGRSWPGLPDEDLAAAQDRPPAGPLGETANDAEATTIVSTRTASEILGRAAQAPAQAAQYGDGKTEIVNVWPGAETPGNRPQTTAQHGAGETEIVRVWPGPETADSEPPGLSAATVGSDRAVDALTHVDVKSSVKMPSKRGWRRVLYMLTRINLGLSPDETYEMDLHTRIRRNARDSYQIGVIGLKGGGGKTAVTVALGSLLSKVRGDRILAVDADPDAGNLADRFGRESAASIADLLADRNLSRYNDIRAYTSMNRSNLEVLASDDYSVARRAFGPQEWDGTTRIVSRYYNLVLADCGAGLFHPAARAVLQTVSGLVIVASASIDGAKQAAVTLDWLRQNGYQHLLGRTCVVINHTTPGKPNVDVNDLVQQFQSHVSAGRVIVLPYDKQIAAGKAIDLDLLGKTYQRRITELAAALSDDFERLERR
jgi:MinD-like ATPase involved in chromosome partitioning or flagellar assembly